MCGGPSKEQKAAAASQADLDKQLADQFKTGSAVTNPFYTNLINKGDPNFNAESQYATSSIAKDVNQQQAMMKNRLAGEGSALPSGFAESAMRDMQESGAQSFDQGQLALMQQQEQMKLAGAAGLNPLAKGMAAQGGNQSIMQAPLKNDFWSNVILTMMGNANKAGQAAAFGA